MFATRCLLMAILITTLLMSWPARVRQDDEPFQSRSIKIGSTEYRYRVFVPRGWSKKKKWPVVLFLHGAGERGDDNTTQTRVGIGPAVLRQLDNFPSIVVLPQCPRNRWWTDPEMQTLALKALEQIRREAAGQWPGVQLGVHHRIGRLEIGEASIVIAAASAHRADAFAVCRYVIERVKQIVPIWKHEFFEGGEVWIEGATANPADETARLEAVRRACV